MAQHHAQFDMSQIAEFIYLGTNLCCLTRSHFQILIDAGITVEIDLEQERQEKIPETEIYLWLPVKDKTAPSEEQIEAAVALMGRMISREKKVYVHCELGHGRSPTIVAAYLISQGQTVDEALETIKAARPEIHIEDVQYGALVKYYERVNK